MRIVADENIPLAREAFGAFGDVVLAPGRKIDRAMLADADVLVVRSVTRVDEALLDGSRVRFVGTATIGTDHVDLAALARRGIAFSAAPGCNARSVAEYVVAALLALEVDLGRELRGATIGVVGVGNVGSRVATLARALGMRVLLCDPPRAEREAGFAGVSFGVVVRAADVLTFHVPLERGGDHPTRHLLDAEAIEQLRPGAIVFNSSRGGVLDDDALAIACAAGRADAVLDVWEAEPRPSAAMLGVVRFATPHIAGYSLDGKLAGTRMIAAALAAFLGAPAPPAETFHVPVAAPFLEVHASGRAAVRTAVERVYDLRADDARMRAALADAGGVPEARGAAFDRLRRDYPVRREFAGHEVRGVVDADARETLAALGFDVV
ncbi:4-phosphoerythronate dehydrogenase [Candidatus Binatia bacterium]|nr:4-phosphoerythronate dehydrogenase [Candidatus Binatia bacterium]